MGSLFYISSEEPQRHKDIECLLCSSWVYGWLVELILWCVSEVRWLSLKGICSGCCLCLAVEVSKEATVCQSHMGAVLMRISLWELGSDIYMILIESKKYSQLQFVVTSNWPKISLIPCHMIANHLCQPVSQRHQITHRLFYFLMAMKSLWIITRFDLE